MNNASDPANDLRSILADAPDDGCFDCFACPCECERPGTCDGCGLPGMVDRNRMCVRCWREEHGS